MARFVRFSRLQPSRPQPVRRWLVLAALGAGALGCGEDVLVVNWELRSLSDAGLFDEADAGSGNPQSDNAEQARAAERQRDKPGHDRTSNDDDKTNH